VKSIIAVTAVALVLSAVVHSQAGLTGKWQGETRNGSRILLDLTAMKTVVTGTLTRNDEASTIADGKVSNNTFTFKATLGDQTEGFSGELDGDQITVWLDRQGPSNAVVLKRVKQ